MMAGTSPRVMVEVVTTERGPVEVARVGRGPAVIAVHGIPGSWRQVMFLAEDLAHAFTFVLPSRPGYGSTPIGSGRTPEEQADLYASVLNSLALGDAAVVGVSGGGPSAHAFAQRFPQRTRALVLCCALVPHLMTPPRRMTLAAAPGVGEAAAAIERIHRSRLLRNEVALRRAARRGLTPAEQARFDADPRLFNDLGRFLRSHHESPPGLAGLRNDLGQVKKARRTPPGAHDAVDAPTMVLHGDADTVVPPSHAEHYTRTIRGAVADTYAEAGHLFMLTRRTEVTDRIRRFLEATADPRAGET